MSADNALGDFIAVHWVAVPVALLAMIPLAIGLMKWSERR